MEQQAHKEQLVQRLQAALHTDGTAQGSAIVELLIECEELKEELVRARQQTLQETLLRKAASGLGFALPEALQSEGRGSTAELSPMGVLRSKLKSNEQAMQLLQHTMQLKQQAIEGCESSAAKELLVKELERLQKDERVTL